MIRPKSMTRWLVLSLTVLIAAFGCPAARTPAGGPEPVSDGDRGSRSGTARADGYMPVAVPRPLRSSSRD